MSAFLRVLFHVGALSVGVVTAACAQRCDPDSLVRVKDTYLGVTNSGFRGGAEWDAIWARDVRPLFAGTDSARFVLRDAAPRRRIAYESIEPVFLGARRRAYIGWRQGCGTFLTASGRVLWRESFSRLDSQQWDAPPSRDSVWLRAWQVDSAGAGYRLLLAVRGRVAATLPRLYRASYTQTLHEMTLLPPGVTVVAAHESGGVGLVTRAPLRELVESRWNGVGGLAQVVNGHLEDQFLLADDGTQLHVLRTDGRPVVLPTFHRVETIARWSQLRWPSRFTRVYALAGVRSTRWRGTSPVPCSMSSLTGR